MATDLPAKPGVLLEVLGQGLLLQGEAGIGKSELALGLVDRGHGLVADDRVEFFCDDQGRLCGRARPGCEGFLALRDLGVINLAKIQAKAAQTTQLPIALVIQLVARLESDRLSPVVEDWSVLDCHVPAWSLVALPGRNLPLLVETIVRLNQLALQGYDATIDLQSKLAQGEVKP